jgi:MSHA biogenesis protein MshQ
MKISIPALTKRFKTWLTALGFAWLLGCGFMSPAHAAITYFASASNPADNSSRDVTTGTIVPPASMVVGDLVVMIANAREAGQTITISATGGQSWTTETAVTTNGSLRIFWARYTGSWSTNPAVTFPSGANATTVVMHVFRPTSSVNTWGIDVPQVTSSFAAPASPYNVTIPSITTFTHGALVLAVWESVDNNTWGLQTSGWANAGTAQYRNSDGSDSSQSSAYKIMPTAGASNDVINRQTGRGPDAGNRAILAFKEIFPPTVAKSFAPATIGVNGSSVLTITLTNPNNATAITGAAFTDTYPSTNVKNATIPAGATTCGGTVTAVSGGGSVALSGGTIPASGSCTVTVNVTATVAGSYTNNTGAVSTTNAGGGTAATASLTVTALTVSPTDSTVVAYPTTVSADGVSTATITVTLKDSAGTPVPGKTVTLAAGSGSSVITTVSGTSDASGVATFTVKDSTAEGPIIYTATDTTDSLVITQTAQVTFITPSLCFTDDFNRASLLSTGYWTRTKAVGTALDAEIVSDRLRLTDSAGNRATAVHLYRLFPGAGNKVTAEFTHYAYNGGGADGMVLTLSDSSIAPVAGAFGGSLGYAQKCQNGVAGCTSDCNVSGGCPGFAGGWIGIGFDEYGNYSNPTEGRQGGPGALPDSVTVRGSGSGQSGYNYHSRVAAAGLDNAASTTPAPGHRYRVIVDHSNGTNAYVTVDRDTTGTGTSYTNLVPQYDAKAIVTQSAVPPYWFFSFTASTGGATNIHEIDDMTVCTSNPPVVPTLNHVRIIHDGSALTCVPETVTLKACATAACDALYTSDVTLNLNATAGTWSVANPVTITGGQRQVTLSKTTDGAVTLSGSVTAPTTQTAVCYNGATSGDCSLTYASSACAFDTVESIKNPATPIYTKLAGVDFNLDVLPLTAGAINTSYTGTVTVSVVDQTGVPAGTCSTSALSCTITPASPYTYLVANAGRRTFTFNCPAASDVRVRMVSGSGVTACSSDNFAIRPTGFTVTATSPGATNTATTGTPTLKAGTAFGLEAASANGYTGTALINAYRIQDHNAATVPAGTLSGAFSPATSGTSWISIGTGFTYADVGTFRFAPWGVYDDTFANVDRSKATPECFVDNKVGTSVDPGDPNVKDGNGMYGCYFGGTNTAGGTITSPYFGRFIPDHFELTAQFTAATCGVGTTSEFTYMDHDALGLNLEILAKSSGGATLSRYTAGYPSLGTLAITGGNNGAAVPLSRLSQPALTTVAWTNGAYSSAATLPETHRFDGRNAAPATLNGPYDAFRIKVVVNDPDSAKITKLNGAAYSQTNATDPVYSPTTRIRYGRLRLINTYGSELLPSRVEYRAEYWDGTRWVTNTADKCTSIVTANIARGNTTLTPSLASTPITQLSAGTGGIGYINFDKTSAVGSFDVALDLGMGASLAPMPAANACEGGSWTTGLTNTSGANLLHLAGMWCGSVYDKYPVSRVKLSSPKAPYIYLRERY